MTDLEYGAALASETVESLENGLSREDALRKITETSEQMLRPGGYAVYNLEGTGSKPGIGAKPSQTRHENIVRYGRELSELLEENYTDNIELYEEPDFAGSLPHLVWQKPE